MTEGNTAEGRRQDAQRARELLLRAATHNFGSSVRNDLVAEAAVWAALYQAGVIEETTGRNGAAAAALGEQAEALGGAVRRLADALRGAPGGAAPEGGPAR